MKVWISGEVDSDIGLSFPHALTRVEGLLNEAIASETYDIPLDSWDCIAIIRADDVFPEVTKYSRKRRDMDFRLRVDHAKFLAASPLECEALLFDMLRRSLTILGEKGLAGPELDKLSADATRVATRHGWVAQPDETKQ
jgi:hypothetical protein